MAPDPKQLERPIWSALTTSHARFALGNDMARRFPPDVSPMTAVREVSPANLKALSDLVMPGEIVGLFSAEPVFADGDFAVIEHKSVDQMVYEDGDTAPISGDIAQLTPADVPEMLALAELTKPGPFVKRTIALGTYLGIRSNGELIAMAGERLKCDGYTEISAVCTHPAHGRRGLSSLLVRTLMQQMLARGETPFLHLYSTNTTAAALYRKLGFVHRRSFIVTVLKRERSST
jgi:predicted GNAT family acetyltransferase